MISDCGASPLLKFDHLGHEAPEKWFFRLGLITSAVLLVRAAIFVKDYIKYFKDSDPSMRKKVNWQNVSMTCAVIASVGLAGCAAVSETENNLIHSTLAIFFFVFYISECTQLRPLT